MRKKAGRVLLELFFVFSITLLYTHIKYGLTLKRREKKVHEVQEAARTA